MNINSNLIATTAAAVLVLSFAATAQAKISIVGHDYTAVKEAKVAETYDEPVCKFVKVKFVKQQYGRKIVFFKTRKVCA